eukprot:UN24405
MKMNAVVRVSSECLVVTLHGNIWMDIQEIIESKIGKVFEDTSHIDKLKHRVKELSTQVENQHNTNKHLEEMLERERQWNKTLQDDNDRIRKSLLQCQAEQNNLVQDITMQGDYQSLFTQYSKLLQQVSQQELKSDLNITIMNNPRHHIIQPSYPQHLQKQPITQAVRNIKIINNPEHNNHSDSSKSPSPVVIPSENIIQTMKKRRGSVETDNPPPDRPAVSISRETDSSASAGCTSTSEPQTTPFVPQTRSRPDSFLMDHDDDKSDGDDDSDNETTTTNKNRKGSIEEQIYSIDCNSEYADWKSDEVCKWLQTIKMGQYVKAFKDENITGISLTELDDDDLQELMIKNSQHRKNSFIDRKMVADQWTKSLEQQN